MNKSKTLGSLLVLSGFILSPMTIAGTSMLAVIANPSSSTIQVTCPVTSGPTNVITNFGFMVAGYGVEKVGAATTQVYFRSDSLPAGMPRKLGNYTSSDSDYDSTIGQVTCTYTSSDVAEPTFTVAYYLTNGVGGNILAQSANTVTVDIPFGFKKA